MSEEFPLSHLTQSEAYVELAKFGISVATSPRALRNSWVTEMGRREEYGLDAAQIAVLVQANKDQIAILEEGAVPEKPQQPKKRSPVRHKRPMI